MQAPWISKQALAQLAIVTTFFVSGSPRAQDTTRPERESAHHHQQDHGSCCSKHKSAEAHPSDPESTLANEALEVFHHAVEGEHVHAHDLKSAARAVFQRSTLQKWLSAFNFKEVGINAYRAFQIKSSQAATRNHAINLLLIVPVAHGLEMLSGPIASTIAHELGASVSTVLGLGAAGAIISIPGIDPLCILIFATYPLKPVHATMTLLRRCMVGTAQFMCRISGLAYAWRALSQTDDAMTQLEALSSQTRPNASPFQYRLIRFSPLDLGSQSEQTFPMLITADDEPWLELHIGGTDRFYLRHVVFHAREGVRMDTPSIQKELGQALDPFHWNVRDALMRVHGELIEEGPPDTHHKPPFYVESRTPQAEGTFRVTFKPHAVPLPARTTFPVLKKLGSFCEKAFR